MRIAARWCPATAAVVVARLVSPARLSAPTSTWRCPFSAGDVPSPSAHARASSDPAAGTPGPGWAERLVLAGPGSRPREDLDGPRFFRALPSFSLPGSFAPFPRSSDSSPCADLLFRSLLSIFPACSHPRVSSLVLRHLPQRLHPSSLVSPYLFPHLLLFWSALSPSFPFSRPLMLERVGTAQRPRNDSSCCP